MQWSDDINQTEFSTTTTTTKIFIFLRCARASIIFHTIKIQHVVCRSATGCMQKWHIVIWSGRCSDKSKVFQPLEPISSCRLSLHFNGTVSAVHVIGQLVDPMKMAFLSYAIRMRPESLQSIKSLFIFFFFLSFPCSCSSAFAARSSQN